MLQFTVNFNAQRLKNPGSWMNPGRHTALRHAVLNQLSELTGRGQRRLVPSFDYPPGDTPGIALFAIFEKNPRQFLSGVLLQDIGSSQAGAAVHAHIEGCIDLKGKSPVTGIELKG